jgi:hypothetical protein
MTSPQLDRPNLAKAGTKLNLTMKTMKGMKFLFFMVIISSQNTLFLPE